ncbi:amino acid transporter [Suillus discolor]|uniref:Amino acid transporter n=1 Tax=Suillus discolor TaxID=1912936 RepID=A0A9P7FLF5_9AGAM|nr:amino acid transporter [Suillus discolor]KAG2119523.1 amino acid transporter [Suillus discolor]
MFSANSRAREAADGEARQPLLNASHEDVSADTNQLVFSVDDEDSESGGAEPWSTVRRTEPGVRFQEEVQVIGPPLRSTIQSREAEYELDSDDFDDASLADIQREQRHSRGAPRRERTMPLLVGLMDASAARRTPDTVIPMYETDSMDNGALRNVDLDDLAEKQWSGGGLLNSVANMANSILGAGIIGLPYAVNQAGFFLGIVLLVGICAVTDWTIRLVVINAKLSGRTSYIEVMNSCFGPSGRAAVSFFQFSFAFGGMCAFGIIIGDTIPHVIRSIFPTLHTIPVLSLLTNRQFIITLCTTCVSYPLSLYRDIHKLSRASGLALISMLVIVSAVLIEGSHVSPNLKGDPSKRLTVVGSGVFQAIGVMSFAFVCHHNSLLIYGSLKTPTLDRFAQVTHISTIISLVACCTLAISGFWVFTDRTQGNILNNFSGNDALINVARFCFGLNMFTTLPLELFVCREVIEQYFFSHESYNIQRHVFFTSTILFSSMLLSLITCDLGVTLEITGGVSATALAYIFPAACYLKLTDPHVPWYSRAKLPAAACLAFGVAVMTVSLLQVIQRAYMPLGEPKMCMA